MKKIILAFEGDHFSEGAFEFAKSLNKMSRILVTGVFLPQVVLSNLWSYADGSTGPAMVPLVEEFDAEVIQNNIRRFEDLCTGNAIEHRVHRDYFDMALPALKAETRYADLLVLGSESFYKNIVSGQPNDYLKEALHSSECPVVVVPEKHQFPKSNILAYDGTESSVYAIKQFAYLFPELAANPTLLITVSKDEKKQIEGEKNMKELVAAHFPLVTVVDLQFKANDYFSTWISEKESSILVSGSFGRSAFSRMFKKSFSADVIADHHIPVFAAHK